MITQLLPYTTTALHPTKVNGTIRLRVELKIEHIEAMNATQAKLT